MATISYTRDLKAGTYYDKLIYWVDTKHYNAPVMQVISKKHEGVLCLMCLQSGMLWISLKPHNVLDTRKKPHLINHTLFGKFLDKGVQPFDFRFQWIQRILLAQVTMTWIYFFLFPLKTTIFCGFHLLKAILLTRHPFPFIKLWSISMMFTGTGYCTYVKLNNYLIDQGKVFVFYSCKLIMFEFWAVGRVKKRCSKLTLSPGKL